MWNLISLVAGAVLGAIVIMRNIEDCAEGNVLGKKAYDAAVKKAADEGLPEPPAPVPQSVRWYLGGLFTASGLWTLVLPIAATAAWALGAGSEWASSAWVGWGAFVATQYIIGLFETAIIIGMKLFEDTSIPEAITYSWLATTAAFLSGGAFLALTPLINWYRENAA